ncbi:DNA ligase (ATP) [Entophlyctis sp. JEL0112]|nr:DNA ligase (ATP) [Entophlyctis sp. JEL0112]
MSDFSFLAFARELDRMQRLKPGHGNGGVSTQRKAAVHAMLNVDRSAHGLVLMSLLLPHLDQRVLQIKDKVLARIYADVLGIEGTAAASRLSDWRNPAYTTAAALDPSALRTPDFAQALYSVVRDRISSSTHVGKPLSIHQVNDKINELVAAESIMERKSIVAYFVAHMTPTEHKWLARIILKEMKMGMTEKTVFDAWHPEAQDLFNITSSLVRVATDLLDPDASVISSSSVSLNFPFKPMLAKSVKSLDSVEKLRQGRPFWIETKLDGERMQLHKSGSNYKWFSRNAKDYTSLYGAFRDEKLAQYIHGAFVRNTENCILDGEMMSYNVSTGVFESFGSLKTAANLFNVEGDRATSKPVYMVFDILMYNDKSLLTSPLRDRYKLLGMVLAPKKGCIEILDHIEGSTTDDVVRALDASMLRREEGIVVKDPDSDYLLNDRSGDWLKVKPDYIDSLGDDLDLVLIGGFFGSGYRAGKLSHFMCAIVDDSSPPGEPRYVSFCKFGSGYKEDQIEEISHESAGHWQAYDHQNPPTWFVHMAASKEKPNMILHPSHSRVVTVKAAEIVESTQYSAGYTLRFPRFVCMRPDKSTMATDGSGATTRSQLMEIIQRNAGRMQSRRFVEGDDANRKKDTTPRKSNAGRSAPVLEDVYRVVKIDREINMQADGIFKDLEVCVIPGAVVNVDGLCLKHDLEREILKYGGSCVQNPRDTTSFVIADRPILKVANLMKEKIDKRTGRPERLFDIVKSDWILGCIDGKERLPLEPRYMLFSTEKTKRHFKTVNDKFGDSFTRDVTVESLEQLFENIPAHSLIGSRTKRANPIDAIESRKKQLVSIAEIEAKLGLDLEAHDGNRLRNMCAFLDIHSLVPISPLMLKGWPDDVPDGVVVMTEEQAFEMPTCNHYNSLTLLGPEIMCRGGQITDVFGPWTTHIVLGTAEVDLPLRDQQEETAREQFFLQLLLHYPGRHTQRPNIVNSRWMKDRMD